MKFKIYPCEDSPDPALVSTSLCWPVSSLWSEGEGDIDKGHILITLIFYQQEPVRKLDVNIKGLGNRLLF